MAEHTHFNTPTVWLSSATVKTNKTVWRRSILVSNSKVRFLHRCLYAIQAYTYRLLWNSWSSSISTADKEAGQTDKEGQLGPGIPLDPVEVVGQRRMMAKLSSLMDNQSHPLQDTITALGSSFSNRLIHRKCLKQRYHRSFLPAAVRLYNYTHHHYGLRCNCAIFTVASSSIHVQSIHRTYCVTFMCISLLCIY